MTNMHTSPSKPHYALTVISIFGCLLLFAIVVGIAYLPNRPEPVDHVRIDERKQIFSEVTAKQVELTTTYAWEDASAGVVRIPVELAIDIIAKEQQR